MARIDPRTPLLPSVLDRLVDPDSGGTAWRQGYSVDDMLEVVRRDLEELLNTRQSHQGLPAAFVETHRSIFGYGLPDLISLNAFSPEQRAEIGRVLEAVIACFEPRLKDIRAFLVERPEEKGWHVLFRVEGRLAVEPAPEVAFETVLEATTGHYSVRHGEAAS